MSQSINNNTTSISLNKKITNINNSNRGQSLETEQSTDGIKLEDLPPLSLDKTKEKK